MPAKIQSAICKKVRISKHAVLKQISVDFTTRERYRSDAESGQMRLGARVETLIRMQRLKIEDCSKTKTSSGTSVDLKRHELVG